MYPYPQQHPYTAPQPAMAHPQRPASVLPAYPQPVPPYAQAPGRSRRPMRRLLRLFQPQPRRILPPHGPPAAAAAAGLPRLSRRWRHAAPTAIRSRRRRSAYPGAPQPAAYPQAYADPVQSEQQAASREMSPIEEMRESLREFREAIRDLAADRARRRYF